MTSKRLQINSRLMAEEYDVSGSSPRPRQASYQIYLSVQTEYGESCAGEELEIRAEEPCQMTANGQRYELSPDRPAYLETDAGGEVMVALPPTTFTAPRLRMRGDFMPVGAWIRVTPGKKTEETLASVQASDLSPSAAVTYSGEPVLLSNYRSETNRSHLSNAIRNTLGKGMPGLTADSPFIVNPDLTPEACYVDPEHPHEEAWAAGDQPHWEFRLSDDTCVFQPLHADTAARIILEADGPQVLGFEDFVRRVVQGAEKVVRVVWESIRNAANVLVQTLGNTYKFVVQLASQAVQVVAAYAKRVVGELRKVAEWLSFIFNWGDIVEMKKKIVAMSDANLKRIRTWLRDDFEAHKDAIERWFKDQASDFADKLEAVARQVTDTPQTIKNNHGDPARIYAQKGADAHGPVLWFQNRLKQGAAMAVLAVDEERDNRLIENIGKFVTRVEHVLKERGLKPGEELVRLAQKLQNELRQPETFLKTSLGGLLRLVGSIGALVIDLAGVLVVSMLELIRTIFELILDFFSAEISIPILSDLYKQVAGAPLTLMDLAALMVAIPATLIGKAIGGLQDTASWFGPNFAYTLAYIGFAVANAVHAAASDTTAFFAGIAGGLLLSAMMQVYPGRPHPKEVRFEDVLDYVLWFAGGLPLIGFFLDAHKLKYPQNPLARLWKEGAPAINACYGMIMMVLYTIVGSIWIDKYRGKDWLQMVQNLGSSVGSVAQVFLLPKHPWTKLVILVGLLSDLSNAGLSFRHAELFQRN